MQRIDFNACREMCSFAILKLSESGCFIHLSQEQKNNLNKARRSLHSKHIAESLFYLGNTQDGNVSASIKYWKASAQLGYFLAMKKILAISPKKEHIDLAIDIYFKELRIELSLLRSDPFPYSSTHLIYLNDIFSILLSIYAIKEHLSDKLLREFDAAISEIGEILNQTPYYALSSFYFESIRALYKEKGSLSHTIRIHILTNEPNNEIDTLKTLEDIVNNNSFSVSEDKAEKKEEPNKEKAKSIYMALQFLVDTYAKNIEKYSYQKFYEHIAKEMDFVNDNKSDFTHRKWKIDPPELQEALHHLYIMDSPDYLKAETFFIKIANQSHLAALTAFCHLQAAEAAFRISIKNNSSEDLKKAIHHCINSATLPIVKFQALKKLRQFSAEVKVINQLDLYFYYSDALVSLSPSDLLEEKKAKETAELYLQHLITHITLPDHTNGDNYLSQSIIADIIKLKKYNVSLADSVEEALLEKWQNAWLTTEEERYYHAQIFLHQQNQSLYQSDSKKLALLDQQIKSLQLLKLTQKTLQSDAKTGISVDLNETEWTFVKKNQTCHPFGQVMIEYKEKEIKKLSSPEKSDHIVALIYLARLAKEKYISSWQSKSKKLDWLHQTSHCYLTILRLITVTKDINIIYNLPLSTIDKMKTEAYFFLDQVLHMLPINHSNKPDDAVKKILDLLNHFSQIKIKRDTTPESSSSCVATSLGLLSSSHRSTTAEIKLKSRSDTLIKHSIYPTVPTEENEEEEKENSEDASPFILSKKS